MEMARVAAARGHDVSLWDKSDDLGGLTLTAAKAPGREDIGELVRYYRYQMKLNNVDVHLNSEVTVDAVLEQQPDIVVIATGSLPYVPDDIPGVDQDNVVDVRDVLNDTVEVGRNVVVIDNQSHIQGLSTADYLLQQGKKVEVVFPGQYPGPSVENITRAVLLQRLLMNGVTLTPNTRLREISGNKVTVTNVYTEEDRVIDGIDTVVLAFGGVENNGLYYALKDKVKNIHVIGDCRGVSKILWAVNDGATLARSI